MATTSSKKVPIILKKGSILKRINSDELFREQIIFDTTDQYYLKGEYQRLKITNNSYIANKNKNRTIAKYFSSNGAITEKTSDRVVQIIGQEQYNTVFIALCSIIDQDLKIRSILSLLTTPILCPVKYQHLKPTKEIEKEKPPVFVNNSCQTDEFMINTARRKNCKRIRKPVKPYIVKDEPYGVKKARKIIVDIPKSVKSNHTDDSLSVKLNKIETESTKSDSSNETIIPASNRTSIDTLPEIGHLLDETSNGSCGMSILSDTPTLPENLTNSFLSNVDRHTKANSNALPLKYELNVDGNKIMLPCKPEDMFHIATKENLDSLDRFEKRQLLTMQLKIDFKYCLTPCDDDGNLPIHIAVLNSDLNLVNRQCEVLKLSRGVDIPVNGLTPLQLALHQTSENSSAMCRCLIHHGASPVRCDYGDRTATHIAAERGPDTLRAVLDASRSCARRILKDEDLLTPEDLETKCDSQLADLLMDHMCSVYDKQGYTPLMAASMLGLYENVRIIIEHSARCVNDKMPTSGNTALYLTVAAACSSAAAIGNKSKLQDHFAKTIEFLLDNGADPAIENHNGTNVTMLLLELSCTELSTLIANKLIQVNFIKHEVDETPKNIDKFMFVKDQTGNIECKTLVNEKRKYNTNKRKGLEGKKVINNKNMTEVKSNIDNKKPVIVQNILLSSGNTSKDLIDKSTKCNAKLNRIVGNSIIPIAIQSPIVLPAKNTILKRKIIDEIKTLKQAKTE